MAFILSTTLPSQKRSNRESREENAKAHETCFQTQNDVIFHENCLFFPKLFNKHFSLSSFPFPRRAKFCFGLPTFDLVNILAFQTFFAVYYIQADKKRWR